MLIAEVGRQRGEHHVQPTLCCLCEKTVLLNAEKSKWAGKLISALSDRYRSWVPDEDLGMSVGELICWDLEVGHQHLHSFPMESQRGHVCHPLHTWHFNWPQITQRQKSTKISSRWSQHEWTWQNTEKQLNKIVTGDRADRICAFPSTQGETCQARAVLNTGER